MNFWSKGLGNETIDLYLSKGESIRSEGMLYVKGQMEAPVSWEYIMPMDGEDLVDFFALLQDSSLSEYVYRSPNRWQLLWGMMVGGLALVTQVVRSSYELAMGRADSGSELVIEVPPPYMRKQKKAKKAAEKKPVRRRLSGGSKRLSLNRENTTSNVENDPPSQISAAGR